jgi:Protein of unknown function (DUF2505)
MADVMIRHELPCTEDTYWNHVTFDPEFNRRLYVDILKFPGYEVLSETTDGARRSRRIRFEPPLGQLPTPIKKVLGDSLAYTEEGTFDPALKRYAFKIIPSALAEKTRAEGELRCEPLGPTSITLVAKMTIQVKVFVVGSMIEDKIANDMRGAYEAAARFTQQFLKEKGL